MLFAAQRLDGNAVRMDRIRRREHHVPSRTQVARHRWALWLHAVEVGLYDPRSGRVRPHTPTEIARIYGVTVQHVREGIAVARQLREVAR